MALSQKTSLCQCLASFACAKELETFEDKAFPGQAKICDRQHSGLAPHTLVEAKRGDLAVTVEVFDAYDLDDLKSPEKRAWYAENKNDYPVKVSLKLCEKHQQEMPLHLLITAAALHWHA